MQPFEVDAILENADYIDSFEWDRTRLTMYGTIAPMSKNKLKPTDILAFPWDKEASAGGGTDTSISSEDITRLREKAKIYGNI